MISLSVRSAFVFRRAVLLACLISVANCLTAQSSKEEKKEYFVTCIGFYNLENLFDTIIDPDTTKILQEEFTPEGKNQWNTQKYQIKLNNMSDVISRLGKEVTPDGVAILGIAEIENRKVVEDLINMPKLKPFDYDIVHYDSPDRRGVDVGLIYQKKYFTVTSSKSYNLKIEGKDNFYTRDQLLVSGLLQGEPIHVIVGHWPSRRGGEKRSSPLRIAAAKLSRHITDSLLAEDKNAKIIIMGDLNDDPVNESIKKYLRADGKASALNEGKLFNTMEEFYHKGIGTLAWNDAWNLFDQIIISQEWLKEDKSSYRFFKARVFNEEFLREKNGRFQGYPFRTFSFGKFTGGYSDHFPTYVFMVKEK